MTVGGRVVKCFFDGGSHPVGWARNRPKIGEALVEGRDQLMMPILSYAHYDPIREDPRFVALLRKMKLK